MTNNIDSAPIGLLTGKVVFITGASRGIGAAAARLFAREGAAVVLAARSTDALEKIVAEIRADGGVADAVTVDLADRASIRAAIGHVEELHGRLDGAFNNGAAIQQPGPLDTTSDEDIEQQFAVNFRAHWTAMTAEAELMRRGSGSGQRQWRRGDRQHLEHRQPPREPGTARVRGDEARPQQHHRDRRRDLGTAGDPG